MLAQRNSQAISSYNEPMRLPQTIVVNRGGFGSFE